MKLGFTFFGMLLCMQFGLHGQPGNYSWTAEFDGNFTNTRLFGDGPAGATFRALTVQADSNDNEYLIEWDSFDNKWQNTSSPLNSEFTLFHGDGASPNGAISSGATSGKYYTFQIEGLAYADRNAVIMETSNSPIDISSLSFNDDVFFGEDVDITVTLSGNKSVEERVFIRYTDDGFLTSNLAEVSFTTSTSSTGVATIPDTFNTAGKNVDFYAYSTTVNATSTSNHDLISLRINNNSGSNYSYTVRSEYITQSGATNWNSDSSWRAGVVPPNTADVVVAHNLSLTDDREVQSIEVESGVTLSFSDAETLTIRDTGTLTNNGTLNHANGSINFLGSGSISGTLSLNDVVLNNGGVSFGTTCTINGNLTLNSGSFVNTDSPIYAPGSTLIYNAGSNVTAPYQRRSEWSNADPQGTPYNVIVQNNTAVNLGFERKTFDAIMKGNLSIDAGSFMLMDFGLDDMTASLVVEGNFLNNGQISLSGLAGGDLKVFGDFTSNGTFQDNNRALLLEGNATQQFNAATEFGVPFLIIAKTAGEVVLNQDIIISGNGDGLQMSDQAILNLNGNQLQLGNASNTSVVFNDNSALKASPTSRFLFSSTNATAGNLKFVQTAGENALSEFEMDGSGGISISDTLNIHNKFILKNGTFTSNGNLTLKSSVTKTAIIPEVLGGSISGNIRVERYFSDVNRSFRYVSSPVSSTENIRANWQEGVNNTGTNYPADNQNPNPGFGTHITGSTSGANGFDATLTGNPSLFTWDNTTQTWSAIPNTNATNLEAGKAYALMVRGDRSTNLSSNDAQGGATVLRSLGNPEVGTFSIPSSEMPTAAEEFALIGNPYQAQVNVKNITTTGLNTNFMYIWDPNIGETGGYTAIDLTEDPVTTTPASAANERLQPSQAFFMETSAATSSVSFEESHKTEETLNVETFAISAMPEINVVLAEENSSTIDGTRVVFSEDFSEAVTFEDAKKLWNNAEYLAISKPNYWLAIEKKPLTENDTIQLYSGNYLANDYQLAIDINNLSTHEVFLRDRYEDEVYTLENASTNVHNFLVDPTIPESISTERFQLILEEIPLSTISEIQPEIKIHPNPVSNGKISIENTFQQGEEINLVIYDLLGRAMISSDFKANSNFIEMDVSSLKTGLFILQLKSETGVLSHKLIVE